MLLNLRMPATRIRPNRSVAFKNPVIPKVRTGFGGLSARYWRKVFLAAFVCDFLIGFMARSRQAIVAVWWRRFFFAPADYLLTSVPVRAHQPHHSTASPRQVCQMTQDQFARWRWPNGPAPF